jgi:hypothetical protein
MKSLGIVWNRVEFLETPGIGLYASGENTI